MKIKELERIDLGIPCKWVIENCPYYENGIAYKQKLECSPDYGIKCNGNKYKVTYLIDGEIHQGIESAEFSRPLEKEIDVPLNKENLIKNLKDGNTLHYILLRCNLI